MPQKKKLSHSILNRRSTALCCSSVLLRKQNSFHSHRNYVFSPSFHCYFDWHENRDNTNRKTRYRETDVNTSYRHSNISPECALVCCDSAIICLIIFVFLILVGVKVSAYSLIARQIHRPIIIYPYLMNFVNLLRFNSSDATYYTQISQNCYLWMTNLGHLANQVIFLYSEWFINLLQMEMVSFRRMKHSFYA